MILIVDNNYRKDSLGFDEFVRPIVSILEKKGIEYEIRHFSEADDQEFSKFDKIILSGTPLKDNFFTGNLRFFEWIKDVKCPILGICAGMEIIGLIFGSSIKKCQEIGFKRIETVKENPLFYGKFDAYELHNHGLDSIENFDVIATSDKCIQAIKHKGKPIFGVMFHPEVRNEDIIINFLEKR